MNKDNTKERKGTLPLIWEYLTESEKQIFKFLDIESEGTSAAKQQKTINTKNKQHNKIMVKETIPLIAQFLDTSEERVEEIFELNSIIKTEKKD